MPGEGLVQLVGAGPGDPELITVAGRKAIRTAELVVFDRLVSRRLLQEASAQCQLIDVGKRPGQLGPDQQSINELLVRHAKAGKRVVRLKGGDPFVFGRGGEELAYCRKRNVPCEVIPGISSALAGPASLGIPVTHRGVARSCAIVTGHSGDLDFEALARLDSLIILMGRSRLPALSRGLIQAGKSSATPAAAVQWATTKKERRVVADLGSIAEVVEKEALSAPIVVVVGEVVKLSDSKLEKIPEESREQVAS